MKNKSIRYPWLDVLKGFCIFFIIYAHLNGGDKFGAYVFTFMVQAFFFASGVTVSKQKDRPIGEYIKLRFKRLMIPYFVYGAFAMLVKFLIDTDEVFSPTNLVLQLLYGYRIKLFAITLWFLPCLFILGIYYQIILKFVKNKWARLALCFIISFVFRIFSEGNMLPWGIDNAVRFLIYYCVGDVCSDFLNSLSRNPTLIFKKVWPALLMAVSIVLSYLLHQYGYTYLLDLAGIPSIYMVLVVVTSFYAFVGIYLFSMISILIQDVKPMQSLGKASLIICCLQLAIDRFVYTFASMLGFTIHSETQGQALMLAVLFVIIGVQAYKFIEKYFPQTLGFKKVNNTNNI